MRYNLPPNRFTLYLRYNFGETWMEGMLATTVKGTEELNHVRKMDFDAQIRSLDFSSITGTLDRTAFPEFKGDFYKDKVGNYYLKPIAGNVREGSYFTVNEKGLITKVELKIPPSAWGNFGYEYVNRNTLPTDVTELNLKDVIHLNKKDNTTGRLDYMGSKTIKKRPTILGDVALLYGGNIGFIVGDMVLAPYGADLSVQKFVRSNGSLLSQKDYPDAYKVFGDDYGFDYGKYGNGTPWRNQSNISNLATMKIDENKEQEFFPNTMTFGGYAVFVTNNKVFMLGGSPTYSDSIAEKKVTMYNVSATGELTVGAVQKDLLDGRKFARAVCANGYVYVIGGWSTQIQKDGKSSVMRAKLNADGNIGEWEYTGKPLINLFCSSDVFVVKRRLYVRGGWVFTPKQFGKRNDRVFYCHINKDGSLSDWIEDYARTNATRDNSSYSINNTNINALRGESGGDNPSHFAGVNISRYSKVGLASLRPSFTKHPSNASNTFVSKGAFVTVSDLLQEGAPEGSHGSWTLGTIYPNGYPTIDKSTTTLSPHRLSFFDGFAVKDHIYIPGGYKTALEATEKATPQVWRRIKIAGFGLNNYMPYIDGSKKSEDVPKGMFMLPDLEPEIFDGVVYEYFVKVL